jgi:hypothetical protein
VSGGKRGIGLLIKIPVGSINSLDDHCLQSTLDSRFY